MEVSEKMHEVSSEEVCKIRLFYLRLGDVFVGIQ